MILTCYSEWLMLSPINVHFWKSFKSALMHKHVSKHDASYSSIHGFYNAGEVSTPARCMAPLFPWPILIYNPEMMLVSLVFVLNVFAKWHQQHVVWPELWRGSPCFFTPQFLYEAHLDNIYTLYAVCCSPNNFASWRSWNIVSEGEAPVRWKFSHQASSDPYGWAANFERTRNSGRP